MRFDGDGTSRPLNGWPDQAGVRQARLEVEGKAAQYWFYQLISRARNMARPLMRPCKPAFALSIWACNIRFSRSPSRKTGRSSTLAVISRRLAITRRSPLAFRRDRGSISTAPILTSSKRARRSIGRTPQKELAATPAVRRDKFATLARIRRRRSELSLISRVVGVTLETGCSVVHL